MKVLSLSDLHLDSYYCNLNEKRMKQYCESVLHINASHIDVITVAGDIGHYNRDNKLFLAYLADTYTAKVLFTYGNHDLYLVSDKQITKYKGQSLDRIREMEDWAKSQPNIHFLDGTFIDIEGVRFGGMCNWYDGSFKGLTTIADLAWRGKHSDYFRILRNGEPYNSFFALRDDLDVESKLQTLINSECTYIFTHVCPIMDKDLVEYKYRDDYATTFYFSNDANVLQCESLRYLQFGHTHNNLCKEYGNMFAFNASVGYSNERTVFSPRYLEVTADS